ncbi:unnamed protein product [Rotaria magnacalcarata]|uniref:Carbonic anhydrase n=1 Tax=Rotaria magnacalcarata TaxID=392030 RepID=A0A816LXW7_9BILA|nr:unnamed protein product [Rotaria magnacalcarata]CAF2141039.1 unnamed protein product [Rotaria magnacalcarata]CAF3813409.1 unnamed protein product [Rotaria magnacalcarata]CAF3966613.1 unnamed protein product [Rotaria magnacalcarata]
MSCLDEFKEDWSYDDPSNWHERFPSARGNFQSPINIKLSQSVIQNYPPFTLSPQCKNRYLYTLKNDDHKLTVTLAKEHQNKNQGDLWVRGGGLTGTFHFVNFHLHWGGHDTHGSEHELSGCRFPAEAHFIFKNLENQEMTIFAFFLNISGRFDDENTEWKKYADATNLLKNNGDKYNCIFYLSTLMPIEGNKFFRYIGSLTTPPCTEGIIWTIFYNVIPITEHSLNLLRNNVMRESCRPIQPINDRIIYRNFDR